MSAKEKVKCSRCKLSMLCLVDGVAAFARRCAYCPVCRDIQLWVDAGSPTFDYGVKFAVPDCALFWKYLNQQEDIWCAECNDFEAKKKMRSV